MTNLRVSWIDWDTLEVHTGSVSALCIDRVLVEGDDGQVVYLRPYQLTVQYPV